MEAVCEMRKDFEDAQGWKEVRKKGLGCLIKCNNKPNFGSVLEVTTAHWNNSNKNNNNIV